MRLFPHTQGFQTARNMALKRLPLWLEASLSALATLMLMLIIVFFILQTSLGFKVGVNIAKPFLNASNITLHQGKISGKLSRFVFPGITIKTKQSQIAINNITVKWRPFWLLAGFFAIDHLKVQSIEIDVSPDDSEHQKHKAFYFPVKLNIKTFLVDQLAINVEKLNLDFDRINAKVELYKDLLKVNNLSLNAFDHSIIFNHIDGKMHLNKPFPINARGTVSGSYGQLSLNNNPVKIKGPLDKHFQVYNEGKLTVRNQDFDYSFHTTIHDKQIKGVVHYFENMVLRSKGKMAFDFRKENKIKFNADLQTQFQSAKPPFGLSQSLIATEGVIAKKPNKWRLKLNNCQTAIKKIKMRCFLNVAFSHNQINIEKAKFVNQKGTDKFAIQGQVNDKFNLKWQGQVADFSYYMDDLKGYARSSGKITGPWHRPHINGYTEASNIRINQYEINQLKLKLTYQNKYQLINIKGKTDFIDLHSQIRGKWGKNYQFEGQLINNNILINGKPWILFRKPKFTVSPEQFKLSNFCITRVQQHMCVENININHNLKKGYLHAHINPETLDHFGYIKNASSEINASIKFYPYITQPLYMNASIDMTPGKLRFQNNNTFMDQYFPKTSLKFQIRDFDFHITTMDNHILYNLKAYLRQKGHIISTGQLNLAKDKHHYTGGISSRNAIYLPNTAFVSKLIPFPIKLDGKVEGQFKLFGQINAPKLKGKINYTKAKAHIVPAGIKLDNARMNIQVKPPFDFTINSKAYIDNNPVTLKGNLKYQRNFQTAISIEGDHLQLADLPQLKINASPKLKLTNSQDEANQFIIKGKIDVNRATIKAEELKNTLSSNQINHDITYVHADDQKQNQDNQAKQLPLATNININLGTKTRFYGFGLSSFLYGNVKIHNKPFAPLKGKGAIYFKQGIYSMYGKRFTLTKNSRLNFNNNQLKRPTFNITAHYDIPAQVSLQQNAPSMLGVNITGQYPNINLHLVSDPAMSKANILSYIILGKSLSQTNTKQKPNSSDSSALTQAALTMVINGADQTLLKDIQKQVGITDISVGRMQTHSRITSNLQQYSSSGIGANNTAVFIGKSITPRLYVAYGVGVFTGQQTVTATYQINQNWNLKLNKTSLDTGGDVIYTLTPNWGNHNKRSTYIINNTHTTKTSEQLSPKQDQQNQTP
jgi:autotransporter translocation and assembly factor TamB